MSEQHARPGLAAAALVVHAGLAALIVAASAEPLAALYTALRGPVSFADEVPSAAWLVPPLFAAVLLVGRLVAFVRGRPSKTVWTWAALIAFGAVLAARALEPARGAAPSWTSVFDAPPTLQTVEVLQRMRDAALQGVREQRRVPDDAALLRSATIDGRELRPGYVYTGLQQRPFRVVRVPDARAAVERVLPGDLAGTVYLAVSPDAQRFWLTAVVLLDENGRRSSEMLPGPSGVAVLTNAPAD
jgi:hypothetical protein